MTPAEAACALDGNSYGNEGSPALFRAMKAAGLVAVFGASDDLTEFRGSIDDEIESSVPAYITTSGLLQNACNDYYCPYFRRMKETTAKISAVFDDDGFTFTYRTEIPHCTFLIVDDGDYYCRGIVFALADVKPPTADDLPLGFR